MKGFAQLLSGEMGRKSNQVARGMSASLNVDPLERLNQKMQGRSQGGAVRKKTKEERQRRSMLATYGAM